MKHDEEYLRRMSEIDAEYKMRMTEIDAKYRRTMDEIHQRFLRECRNTILLVLALSVALPLIAVLIVRLLSWLWTGQ